MASRGPRIRAAVAFGLLTGAALLLRPSAAFMLLAAAVFWLVASGWRQSARLMVVAVACAVMVVVPWTIRNAIELDGFIPISVQDASIAGTFNPTSAALTDGDKFAWLPVADRDRDLFDPRRPMEEKDLREELIKARRDAAFEGRSTRVATVAWVAWWVAFPLALLGLWRLRRNRAIVLSVAAFAVGLTLTYGFQGGTRYRAPAEPLAIVLAAVGVLGATRPSGPPPEAGRT